MTIDELVQEYQKLFSFVITSNDLSGVQKYHVLRAILSEQVSELIALSAFGGVSDMIGDDKTVIASELTAMTGEIMEKAVSKICKARLFHMPIAGEA